VLRYTDLLTSHPSNINQVDIDKLAEYFNEEQVIELALTIALANFTNRANDGLQIPFR
jgi:alkylhydroperoxidase family enzyme